MGRGRTLARGLSHRRRHAESAITGRLARAARRVPEGFVALTFDDGPHPSSTGRVLDVLAELDVRATFFCVGRNAQQHPELVERTLAEGHVVGSHSFSHPHPADIPLAELDRDYREGRRTVASVTGLDTPLFRPPHGHLGYRSAVIVRRQAVTTWLWTVDPQDWRPGVTRAEVASLSGAAGSGDVILLHDWVEQPCAPEALDRSATVEALPEVVRMVQERGLHFTTLQP